MEDSSVSKSSNSSGLITVFPSNRTALKKSENCSLFSQYFFNTTSGLLFLFLLTIIFSFYYTMYCIFLSIINSSSLTICYIVVDIGNPCRSSIYDFTHLIKKIFALRIFRVTDCLYSVKGFKKLSQRNFHVFPLA